jgi:hypothetical protein
MRVTEVTRVCAFQALGTAHPMLVSYEAPPAVIHLLLNDILSLMNVFVHHVIYVVEVLYEF